MKDYSKDLTIQAGDSRLNMLIISDAGWWYSDRTLNNFRTWVRAKGPYGGFKLIRIKEAAFEVRLATIKWGWMFNDPLSWHTDRDGRVTLEIPNARD